MRWVLKLKMTTKTMSLLTKFLLGDLFKAAHGRYSDTAKNRRLHRVGQEYGRAAKEEVPGPGRKPAQQDDEQKNPLAAKLDTLMIFLWSASFRSMMNILTD